MTTLDSAAKVRPLDELDLTGIVRPGDTVLWSPGVAEPLPIVERLLAQRHDIGHFAVLSAGAGYADLVRPEHADVVAFRALGGVGHDRTLAGFADILPCHISELPKLIAAGGLTVDVVILHLARNARGEYSLGAASGFAGVAARHARTVIAEVNEQAPWTHSAHPFDSGLVDLAVPTSRPLVEVPTRPPTPVEERVAHHVAGLVEDGATVQLGIGGAPGAVAGLLTGHRDLGLHSGVLGDSAVDLIASGAVTGVSVTGALIGTRRLFEFADGNPLLRVEPVSHTHDHDVLRRLPAFTAINSALEVDLTGQVGAEVAGSAYVGTVGGQGDFIRGALAGEGGRSIIALPSRTAKGRARIVARIGSGVVTTPRADADLVVSEHGVARLRGRSIGERVRALVAIAHPDDREELSRLAAEQVVGLRPKGVQ